MNATVILNEKRVLKRYGVDKGQLSSDSIRGGLVKSHDEINRIRLAEWRADSTARRVGLR